MKSHTLIALVLTEVKTKSILFAIGLAISLMSVRAKADGSWTINLQDFNRCDEFYCPDGSGETEFQQRIRQETGVVLASRAAGDAAPAVVIRPLATGPNPRPAIRPAAAPPPVAPSVADGTTQQEPTGQTNSGGGAPQGQGGGSFSGASVPGGTGFSGSTANPNVKGGLLYATEDPSSGNQNQGNAANKDQNQFNKPLSAVAQNRMQMGLPSQGTERDQKDGQANGAAAGGFGAGMGAGQEGLLGSGGGASGGGAANPAGSGGGDGILDKIAKGLGLDRFYSASGGRRGGAAGAAGAVGPNGRGPGSVGSNGPLADPKAILQRQFDQWKRRNLASQLEFAPAGSSLFMNMCQHYQSYARNNRMQASRLPCQER